MAVVRLWHITIQKRTRSCIVALWGVRTTIGAGNISLLSHIINIPLELCFCQTFYTNTSYHHHHHQGSISRQNKLTPPSLPLSLVNLAILNFFFGKNNWETFSLKKYILILEHILAWLEIVNYIPCPPTPGPNPCWNVKPWDKENNSQTPPVSPSVPECPCHWLEFSKISGNFRSDQLNEAKPAQVDV